MFPFTAHNPAFQGIKATWSGLSALWQRLLPLGRRTHGARTLEHLETLPLTAQSSLALVRLREETLLLGITPHNITLLTKSGDPSRLDLTLECMDFSRPQQEQPSR